MHQALPIQHSNSMKGTILIIATIFFAIMSIIAGFFCFFIALFEDYRGASFLFFAFMIPPFYSFIGLCCAKSNSQNLCNLIIFIIQWGGALIVFLVLLLNDKKLLNEPFFLINYFSLLFNGISFIIYLRKQA